MQLRIAVEVGPVSVEPGFYAAKISLDRLLDATAFKRLFHDRLAEQGAGVLIVSDAPLRTASGGDHTSTIRRARFSPLPVRDKKYADTARVRIPGFATTPTTAPVPTAPERGRVINTMQDTATNKAESALSEDKLHLILSSIPPCVVADDVTIHSGGLVGTGPAGAPHDPSGNQRRSQTSSTTPRSRPRRLPPDSMRDQPESASAVESIRRLKPQTAG